MNQLAVANATKTQILIYYIFVSLTFCYFIYSYRRQAFYLLIILLFYNGLFGFLGKNVQNIYRIAITLFTFYWVIKFKLLKYVNGISVIVSSLFFSVSFLATSFINDDYFQIIFSQFSRFFILFSMFFILLKLRENEQFRQSTDKMLYRLLILQIVLAIVKYFVMGTTESIVGSVASQGGAIATLLPVLGLLFIWYKKDGNLERKDWIFIAGLMFIGFVSLKRAIWFISPVIIALLVFYVSRRRISLRMAFISVMAIPLIFYLGIRLNPTLNRESRIWGSFDLNFAINYARGYSFGEDENVEQGFGRGGATLMLINNLVNGDLSKTDILGYGLRKVYATDYEQFSQLGFAISGKGAATGIFQTMISNGYIGIVAMLWLAISIILYTRNLRFRMILLAYFTWEYFFYTGMSLREPALSFLLVYVVLFSPWRIVPGTFTTEKLTVR